MQPLGRTLLCTSVRTEETLPGSPILLTDDRRAQMTEQQAEVVAVGPGAYDAELEEFIAVDARLQPGTWILHTQFARVYVGEDAFVLHEHDVVAILESP